MKVHYLYQSGVIVELNHHVLIFDYYKGSIPKISYNKAIIVFVSHRHSDHYNPAIFKQLSCYRDVTYVFYEDVLSPYPYYACSGNQTHFIKDFQVKTFVSNDEGVAFLVEMEGKKIYHSGDLHLWNWIPTCDADKQFLIWQKQIFDEAMHSLKDEHIDFACFPVDPRLETHTLDGIHTFLENCDVKHCLAIHFEDRYAQVKKLIETDTTLSSRIIVLEPNTTISL